MLGARISKQAILIKNAVGCAKRSYHDGSLKKVTMNDLPVPSGDWQELHAERNSRYNAWLAIGVLSFVGTCAFIRSTGVVQFNYAPPSSID